MGTRRQSVFDGVRRPRALDELRAALAAKSVHDASGCIVWQASKSANGYGRQAVGSAHGDPIAYAHCLAWELEHGPLDPGMELDHKCRNRACINTQHLEAVTHRENGIRGDGPCGRNARATHCPKGHEYTPENTYVIEKRGRLQSRACRECELKRAASNRAKQKLYGVRIEIRRVT